MYLRFCNLLLKCISNQKTAVHHVIVWNFRYKLYPFAVVKYLYIVLKHFGRSLMIFASILVYLLSCDSAENN